MKLSLLVSIMLVFGISAAPVDLQDNSRARVRVPDVQLVPAPPVTCNNFEVVVNQNCTTGAMQFIVRCEQNLAPYESNVSGDTVYVCLLREGAPITPFSVQVTADVERPIRIFPLCVVFENDTVWYALDYSADSIHVEQIDGGGFVRVRTASSLPVGTLSEYIVCARKAGPTDIQRKIKSINERLKGIGRCVVLPPDFYRCFAERVDTTQLARKEMINLIGAQRVIFIELQQPNNESREQALRIISEVNGR